MTLRATAEQLSPTIYIIRVYACGSPVEEPAEFIFAVVAVLATHVETTATIKALCRGVSPFAARAIAEVLRTLGVTKAVWRHKGRERSIDIDNLLA